MFKNWTKFTQLKIKFNKWLRENKHHIYESREKN